MKRPRSARLRRESFALLHCSFYRPVSRRNALCAVLRARTGKYATYRYFLFFCRYIEETPTAGITVLYSLFGESASIAFGCTLTAAAAAVLPRLHGRAEALHPLQITKQGEITHENKTTEFPYLREKVIKLQSNTKEKVKLCLRGRSRR